MRHSKSLICCFASKQVSEFGSFASKANLLSCGFEQAVNMHIAGVWRGTVMPYSDIFKIKVVFPYVWTFSFRFTGVGIRLMWFQHSIILCKCMRLWLVYIGRGWLTVSTAEVHGRDKSPTSIEAPRECVVGAKCQKMWKETWTLIKGDECLH